MEASANGARTRFTRNLGTIVMDLNDVESIVARTFGGVDNVVVNDLSGTDVTSLTADLARLAASTTPRSTTSSSTARPPTTS